MQFINSFLDQSFCNFTFVILVVQYSVLFYPIKASKYIQGYTSTYIPTIFADNTVINYFQFFSKMIF